MTLIPVFKPHTRESLTKDFDLAFETPSEWVSISFPLDVAKRHDDQLGGLGLDADEPIEYEANRYDAFYDDEENSTRISVYVYMSEDSDRVLAIDSVVQDRDDDSRYDLWDTPIGEFVKEIQLGLSK